MIRIAAQRAARSSAEGPTRHEPTALQTATAAMAHALRALALLGTGPAPPDDLPGDAAGAWADDDYLYIEDHLPDDLGTCIDVSTCGRRLMVRIARALDHRPTPALPPGADADLDGASRRGLV